MPVGSSSAPAKKEHLCAQKPWSLGVLRDPISTAWPTLCLALQNVENCSQRSSLCSRNGETGPKSPVDGLEP